MKLASDRAPDYAFGRRMLALRTAIGLSQAGLAAFLQVSRHAISAWETGQTYPKVHHLQEVIALAVQQHAFTVGHEAEEIRALWRLARQRVLLDEQWLAAVLGQATTPAQPPLPNQLSASEQSSPMDAGSPLPVTAAPRLDWGEALDVRTFYGRATEQTQLAQWVVDDRCRVVSVLGLGGIGKSALVVTAMRQVAPHFEVVIWRSLRDAPPCETLIESCLHVLDPHALLNLPDGLGARLQVLMTHLRQQRVLLVLDNCEMLLEEGTRAGHMRTGYESYARLLRQIGETVHQSCLLLTTREKLADLTPLEGTRTPVRTLRLAGLDSQAGAQLLVDKDLVGTPQEQALLIERYSGNPLALKIVAQTIVDVFGGALGPFLALGEAVFGGVRDLLREQLDRLSPREQHLVYWLAILREPANLQELLAVFHMPHMPVPLIEVMGGLGRRSLIERGQHPGSFTLQSVVLEAVTARLIDEANSEIARGALERLIAVGLVQARAKDYIRRAQEELLVLPLLQEVQRVYPAPGDLESRCLTLLDQMRAWPYAAQGYGPANLLALLSTVGGNLRGFNLSRLALRGVSLQGIAMQDATLSHALLEDSVFNETFDDIQVVTISHTGAYWATASVRGEIRVWERDGLILRHAWRAHTDMVSQLRFSPDGRTLASGTLSGSLKLWDAAHGTLLWSTWRTKSIAGLAFSPDGELLASGGFDGTCWLLDPPSGTPIEEVPHPGPLSAMAWSPDGRLLATGNFAGTIRLWEMQHTGSVRCVRTLEAHTSWVRSLSFAPDGTQLASASLDGTVKLWELASGRCLHTPVEQTERMTCVVWSPDGRTLASAGFNKTVSLWDVEASRSRVVLPGHTDVVTSLAFTPDSRTLISGSSDGTLRVWDVERGQCARVMRGYLPALFDIDWSPAGTSLASGGADTLVTIWNGASATEPRVLRGHGQSVEGVAWSPDGRLLASCGYDSIGVWDTATGVRLQTLRHPDVMDAVFQGVAWSRDGRLLASGSYLQGAQVWDLPAGTRRWTGQTQGVRIRRVTWSPDGTRLAGGCDDGTVYVWDAADGTPLLRLAGHDGVVMSVAWSPDSMRLASGGGGTAGGELFVWDAQRGEQAQRLAVHSGTVSSVAWSPDGEVLISGSDGMLGWWEVKSATNLREQAAHEGVVHALRVSPDGKRLASCGDDGAIKLWDILTGGHLQTLRRDRPYERMDITGLTGVTDAQRASLLALGAVER